MSLKILQKENLTEFIEQLLPQYRIAGPIKDKGVYAFQEITDPAELELEYTTTILPPKKFLLPIQEVLFNFDNSNGGVLQSPPQTKPTIIFGMHTCDLHAVQLLDQVFSSGQRGPQLPGTPQANRHRQHRMPVAMR